MRRTASLLTTIALLAGCGDNPIATETTASLQPQGVTANRGSEDAVQKDLAALRRVTAPFHQFDKAVAAGWSAQITGCMADPTAGGMGFHYGNPTLIDGNARVEEPELLLYEPQKNGTMRLVAVEYIVPLSAWTSTEPPRLFGRDFHVNAAFGIWALHVWVWEENPSGLYADWNPRVNCEHALAGSVMSHH